MEIYQQALENILVHGCSKRGWKL